MRANFSPPASQKQIADVDAQFLDGFQTVGRKARRDHGEALHAGLGEFGHGVRGVGLKPFRASEPRLERQTQLSLV